MKLLLLYLCFLLLQPLSVALAEEMPYGDGLLWQVSRDGEPLAHIFGTMHLTDARILDVPAPVTDSLLEANVTVFEIVLNEDDQLAMAAALLLPDGRRLDSMVGSELFDQAARLAAGYGMPPEALGVLKPWALMPIFSVPPEEFARKVAGAKSLDEALQEEARRLGKPVEALESIGEQLAIFDSMAEADQVAMLRELVEQHEATMAIHEQMKALYLDGDLAGIYALMLDQSTGDNEELAEAFEKRAVIARNQLMAERLAPYLDEGVAFVAVGALHLPGHDGILSLLAARGYQISRVY